MNQPAATSTAQPFDVCIIGAGAAGIVLAEILAREPSLRIVMIEAGPDHFKDRKEPFQVRSVLKPHVGVNEGRVTAFGGATNTWGGGLIRLTPVDFEPIAGHPDTAWPLTYTDLVPHYEAIEELFGFKPAAEGPANLFLDTPDVDVHRREIPVLPFRNKNFARRFGPSLRSRDNVTIHCNATITQWHPASGALQAISVAIDGAAPIRIQSKRFVIAAGIVNTNLLVEQLLRSAGDTRAADQTGRYFHDHVSFPIGRIRPKNNGRFSRRFGYRFERGLMFGEHFDIQTKDARRPGAFFHLAFETESSTVLRPVREVFNAVQQRTINPKAWPSFRELLALCIGVPRLAIMRYIFGRLYLDSGTKILATLDLEQTPNPAWTIGKDLAKGDCAVAWDVDPEDAELATRLLPICNQILDRLKAEADFDLEVMIPDAKADPAAFLAHLRKHAVDTLHSSGGVRMGTQPGAMLDADLRLSATKNVHVLGAAVFPRVGTSNPTHTILALGNRLAQQILADHRRR